MMLNVGISLDDNTAEPSNHTNRDLKDPAVQKATGKTDPVDVMGALREMKNNM